MISAQLFLAVPIAEIGGGYLIWLWFREKKTVARPILVDITLFLYGIIPTFQPAHFGRVYAAYSGIFVIASIL
jgi:small multidrug resistance family-3 protein